MNQKKYKADKLKLGVCYYPEYWGEKMWDSDLERMKQHGIETVRVAEFAWNVFEPTEGTFDFSLFDKFLDTALKYDISVIFCTPTATPPAWATHKYPEILNSDINGIKYTHGQRRHYTYNSPKYRELTCIITEKLAEHYASHPAVIGWQIDNEFNCEMWTFYTENDHKCFREFVKNKYKSLDVLNEAWGTKFWNQTYTSWEEINLPGPTPAAVNATNQHRMLDEKRFISESCIAYCKLQSDIIKKHKKPDQFITTNGIFGHLDSHKLTAETLDFISYDNYPNFANELTAGEDNTDMYDRWASFKLTKIRSISPNFIIMEQQSNGGGWVNTMLQSAPRPKQMRLWTLQAVAHGADLVSYFRWRTCTAGTEIYWHGLLDYSNSDNRRMHELSDTKSAIDKISGVCGGEYISNTAIVMDYDNEWDGEMDKWHSMLEKPSVDMLFASLQKHHIPTDFVYIDDFSSVDVLKKYKTLFYPHPTILTKARYDILKKFVENGGNLVIGACSGYKDITGKCYMADRPGYLKELTGMRVDDFTLISKFNEKQSIQWDNEIFDIDKYIDILEPIENDTHVLACYCADYCKDAPALIKRKVQNGCVYYFGSAFTEKIADKFINELALTPICSDVVEVPSELELAVRENNGKKYLFILNYKNKPISFNVKKSFTDLISGDNFSGKCTIENYDAIVTIIE